MRLKPRDSLLNSNIGQSNAPRRALNNDQTEDIPMNTVETVVTETVDSTKIVPIPFNKLMKGSRNVRLVKINHVAVLAS